MKTLHTKTKIFFSFFVLNVALLDILMQSISIQHGQLLWHGVTYNVAFAKIKHRWCFERIHDTLTGELCASLVRILPKIGCIVEELYCDSIAFCHLELFHNLSHESLPISTALDPPEELRRNRLWFHWTKTQGWIAWLVATYSVWK